MSKSNNGRTTHSALAAELELIAARLSRPHPNLYSSDAGPLRDAARILVELDRRIEAFTVAARGQA
jgi:hypothetical protein